MNHKEFETDRYTAVMWSEEENNKIREVVKMLIEKSSKIMKVDVKTDLGSDCAKVAATVICALVGFVLEETNIDEKHEIDILKIAIPLKEKLSEILKEIRSHHDETIKH